MAKHRIKLSNGAILVIEEHNNELAIRDYTHGEEWWVASISPDGILVATNSSDAVSVLTEGLREGPDSLSTFTIKHRLAYDRNERATPNTEDCVLAFQAEDYTHAIDQLLDHYKEADSAVVEILDYEVTHWDGQGKTEESSRSDDQVSDS